MSEHLSEAGAYRGVSAGVDDIRVTPWVEPVEPTIRRRWWQRRKSS